MADMVTRLTIPSTTPRIVNVERNQWDPISLRPIMSVLKRIILWVDQSYRNA